MTLHGDVISCGVGTYCVVVVLEVLTDRWGISTCGTVILSCEVIVTAYYVTATIGVVFSHGMV